MSVRRFFRFTPRGKGVIVMPVSSAPVDIMGLAPDGPPPPRPMPRDMRLDNLGPRPDLVVCVAPRSLGLAAMRSKIEQLESERNRLLANAAAALERIQVAERDAGGALDEAEAILSSVVTLAGTYIPDPK